jgi:hypothetical protein
MAIAQFCDVPSSPAHVNVPRALRGLESVIGREGAEVGQVHVANSFSYSR